MNPQNETLTNPVTNNFDNNQIQFQISESQSQQWEETVRAWLSTLPEGKIISPDDIEAWIQSNQAFLPDHIKAMPRADLHQQFASIYSTITRSPESLQVLLCYMIVFVMCMYVFTYIVVVRERVLAFVFY